MLRSDLEENFAALIGEIDGIEAQFANSDTARKRLAAVKQGIERLSSQTVAERNRIERAEAALRDSEDYNKILFRSRTGRSWFSILKRNVSSTPIEQPPIYSDTRRRKMYIGKTPLDMAAPTP